MHAELGERAVVEASNHFWEQMLGITMETVPASEVRTVAGHVRGSVQLTGAWNGLVEVRLADRLAYFASAGMLMMPLEAVDEADVLDAVREIANMTAGTIKSSLPRPCAMSLPTSSLVGNAWSGPSNAQGSLVVSLRHPAGDLLVCVLEQECVPQ
jgi:CheY-specific phosphatase CheX